MGTDGDLIDIESCFSGALDSTSKAEGNLIVTLLDGSYSGGDSHSNASVSYVDSGSPDSEQPKVHTSLNGNRMLTAIAKPSTSPSASASGQEPQLKDASSFHRSVSSVNSHRRTLSSSAQASGSMSARHFNPNLDFFCALLDKMESVVPEAGDVLTSDGDADVMGAATASSIKDAVSSKVTVAQQRISPHHGGGFLTMLLL